MRVIPTPTLNDLKAVIAEYEKHKAAPLSRLFEEEEQKRLKEAREDELKARFARKKPITDTSGTVSTVSKPKASFQDALDAVRKLGYPVDGLKVEGVWLDELVDGQIVEKALEEAQAESGIKDYDQWGGF